jgi:hypothetical protein
MGELTEANSAAESELETGAAGADFASFAMLHILLH